MRVLFLTNNPVLGGTARVLTSWLRSGPALGLEGLVAALHVGDMTRWLAANGVPYVVNPMPWPSRWWPVRSLWQAWRLARWAQEQEVELVDCNEHDVYPFA